MDRQSDPNDQRLAAMAEQWDDNSKDIAVLKVKQEYMEKAVLSIGKDVAEMKKAFTTAGGVKLALVTIGAVITFVLSQLWHLIDFKGH